MTNTNSTEREKEITATTTTNTAPKNVRKINGEKIVGGWNAKKRI